MGVVIDCDGIYAVSSEGYGDRLTVFEFGFSVGAGVPAGTFVWYSGEVGITTYLVIAATKRKAINLANRALTKVLEWERAIPYD